MKIAVNRCYGGFGLSVAAFKRLIEMNSPLVRKITYSEYTGGRASSFFNQEDEWQAKDWHDVGDGLFAGHGEYVLYDETGETVWTHDARSYENRTHPDLLAVIKELGEDVASGEHAEIEIVDIPDGIEYEIEDYDGIETVEEAHRSW